MADGRAAGNAQGHILAAREYLNAGDREAATRAMIDAADLGHLGAQVQAGAWLVLGHGIARDAAAGAARIGEAARAGAPIAMRLVASLHAAGLGLAQDWDAALLWLARAASAHDAHALAQLACLLDGTPDARATRDALRRAAALLGHAGAQYALARDLQSDNAAHKASEADHWLTQARRANDPNALAASPPKTPGLAPAFMQVSIPTLNAEALAPQIVWPHTAALPKKETHFAEPAVATAKNLLPRHLCEYVMSAAAPFQRPATVSDAERGETVDTTRTNSAMRFFLLETDVVIESIDRVIAAAAGETHAHGEALSVLRYRPGETYRAHHDYANPDWPRHREQLATRGQRVTTALVYLSDGFTGGETFFNALGWKFRGAPGDAIFFRSLTPEGALEPKSLHTGLPPAKGEKWIASKWYRDRPQASVPIDWVTARWDQR